jgi:orotidine-5'-phosphate decarboxylase
VVQPNAHRLALAADVPLTQGLALFDEVREWVGVVKVGLSLFVEHGPAAVAAFQGRGARIFLDLKLHDIPNTVELAAARAGQLGVAYLTVHASGGGDMLKAAVEGARQGASRAGLPPPTVLAVTVLTSMDDAGLASVGVPATAGAQVGRLAALAVEAGAGGLVCSPREVPALRLTHGLALTLVTPGIRPAGSEKGDQSRVETPFAAVRAGADVLVVGRPLSQAPRPGETARAILAEVDAALAATDD